MSKSFRNWCLTDHDTTKEPWDETGCEDDIKYIVYGYEIGKEGKEHWQIYLQLHNKVRFTWMKKRFPLCHIEPQGKFSSNDQAMQYCKKDGMWFEKGTFCEGQGDRTDIMGMVEKLRDNSFEETVLENPDWYFKFPKALKEYNNILLRNCPEKRLREDKVRDFIPIRGYYVWGPARTGKSKWVREIFRDIYRKPNPNDRWFNHYNGERVLLIEEMKPWRFQEKGTTMPREWWLNILDSYRVEIETKGDHVWSNWDTIVITSNYDILDWEDDSFYNKNGTGRIQFIKNFCPEVS